MESTCRENYSFEQHCIDRSRHSHKLAASGSGYQLRVTSSSAAICYRTILHRVYLLLALHRVSVKFPQCGRRLKDAFSSSSSQWLRYASHARWGLWDNCAFCAATGVSLCSFRNRLHYSSIVNHINEIGWISVNTAGGMGTRGCVWSSISSLPGANACSFRLLSDLLGIIVLIYTHIQLCIFIIFITSVYTY